MKFAEFEGFASQLAENLNALDEVIGLVFLGSSAARERVDEFSDHDFFVVVRTGTAEAMRQDLSWLPSSQNILLSPRETAHGLKVVYQDGHVLEFAVFEDSELELASANEFLVVLDRAEIAMRMASIAKRSAPRTLELKTELELFLALVLIGAGRAVRGEEVAARQHLAGAATEKLIGIVRLLDPPTNPKFDSLNPFRRFEQEYPVLGEKLNQILGMTPIQSAERLLELAEAVLGSRATEFETAFQMVKNKFDWH